MSDKSLQKHADIAVAKGDGIGPEIMDAVIRIFDAAGVPLNYHYVEMGKELFDKGLSTGMTEEAKATIEEYGVLFKGPMETPKGKGVKSINVTARKTWNTYANVRKFRTFKGVDTVFSKAGIPINMTILRENIEDTYGGIEYLHTPELAVGYRIISAAGSRQFFKYVFEYARANNISEVVCAHKANIMKLTDGLFMNTFYDVARGYPDIKSTDLIVDDLAMKLVRFPDRFQLVALSNLQGDIISDLCAGLVGGLGFAPSANIGDNISIFEAVHGTAPDIAGKEMANPTSLLLSGILMLRHVGLVSYADRIENALLYTLEQGHHTPDFGLPGIPALSTGKFADEVIANLGKNPKQTPDVKSGVDDFVFHKPIAPDHPRMMCVSTHPEETVVGGDYFIADEEQAEHIAEKITAILPSKFQNVIISNRGTMVWPHASVYTDSVSQYRVRIECKEGMTTSREEIFLLAGEISKIFKVDDIEVLKHWGDLIGYSKAQGQ